jgi:demethylmenaquinone methyltransferase / 2-methoxy-6-polyprenyl-1,4-benzoquinol methylase
VTGLDLTESMLRHASGVVARAGRTERIRFVLGRGEQLPFRDATFDAVSFTFLLRYVADPAATIRELCRVLAPGGILASIEFGEPDGPVWLPLWLLYTRAVLPAAGWLTGGGEWWRVGKFLGPSISDFYRQYPVGWQVEAWRAAGLTGVTARRMSLGGGIVMWGTRTETGA